MNIAKSRENHNKVVTLFLPRGVVGALTALRFRRAPARDDTPARDAAVACGQPAAAE